MASLFWVTVATSLCIMIGAPRVGSYKDIRGEWVFASSDLRLPPADAIPWQPSLRHRKRTVASDHVCCHCWRGFIPDVGLPDVMCCYDDGRPCTHFMHHRGCSVPAPPFGYHCRCHRQATSRAAEIEGSRVLVKTKKKRIVFVRHGESVRNERFRKALSEPALPMFAPASAEPSATASRGESSVSVFVHPSAPHANAGQVRAPRRLPKSWCPKVFLGKQGWCGPIIMLFLILAASGMLSGPIAMNIAQAAASVSRDVGRVASAGINVTVAVTDMLFEVGRGSASLLQETWVGVDIVQPSVSIHGSKWVMHRALLNGPFFESKVGISLVPPLYSDMSPLKVALRALSPALPEIRQAFSVMAYNASYSDFSFAVTQLAHDYIGVQVLIVNVSFSLRWANPLWGMLDFCPTTQLETVQARLREAVHKFPSAKWIEAPFRAELEPDVLVLRPGLLEYCTFRLRTWWQGPHLLE